jgi:uncharacterized protein (DUF952 family)
MTPSETWESQREAASYEPEAFEREGFVHCTHGEQYLVDVGNRYYVDDPRPHVALQIDVVKLAARVVYEDPEHVFPHVYGPIETDAVVAVREMVRDSGGRFLALAPPRGA